MKRYRVGEFVEPPIEEHDGEWIRYSDHVNALATIREEARRAAFKEISDIIDKAGDEWGDQARARRSKTYSAYVIAALDLKGRVTEVAALEATEKGERDG